MERRPQPIVTATVTTSAPPQPILTTTVSRLQLIVTAMATLLVLTEALLTVTATRPPPIRTHTEGVKARQAPTGTASEIPRQPTGTTLDKVSGRHRAILIRSATRLPSSEAMTITPPFGLGKIEQKHHKGQSLEFPNNCPLFFDELTSISYKFVVTMQNYKEKASEPNDSMEK